MYAICDTTSGQIVGLRSTNNPAAGQVSVQVTTSHEVMRHPSWYRLSVDKTSIEADLGVVKADRITELALKTNGFIVERYPPHRQRTMEILYSQANKNGLVNRSTYLDVGFTYGVKVLAWYYAHEDAIVALATKDGVVAYSWDFATLPVDPQVTIRGALNILD